MDSFNSFVSGASWSDDETLSDDNRKGTGVFHPIIEFFDNENDSQDETISIDILPDDMQERILSCLPVSGLCKVSCVSKKWNEIIHSKNFTLKDAPLLHKKPWYFMYTTSDEHLCYLYDSSLRRWHRFELLFTIHNTWLVAASGGLVCFMDEDAGDAMYVCNPISRDYETLENPPSHGFAVYSGLALSADRSHHAYTVSVVRSMQASEDFMLWNVSIHVYRSKEKSWSPPVMGSMVGWRPGDITVICDNVLYVLLWCTRTGEVQNGHGVISYDLDDKFSPIGVVTEQSIIPAPCSLTCGRLMVVQRKVVLVGGIGRPDRPGVIKGIGIWVLKGKQWEEITRMPHKFAHGFGELDDVFASSGGGDLVYIQSYGGTALLVYDMAARQWFWSQKCSMHKKFPLQIFSGFCFEPWLQFLS